MRFCVADVIYPGVKSKRALTNVFVTITSRFREWSQGELRMINILMFFIFWKMLKIGSNQRCEQRDGERSKGARAWTSALIKERYSPERPKF